MCNVNVVCMHTEYFKCIFSSMHLEENTHKKSIASKANMMDVQPRFVKLDHLQFAVKEQTACNDRSERIQIFCAEIHS